ncbi:cilia- and flagella-associated protein 43 [Conger conger]|uniref:cilia- and flagella-associated protein 43 n=1 Tax=Conger conger TaxID=82655 RepID=UPI002A5AA136|nr:cilia- and flagella-associated protein 43 [Conger conger]
MDVLGTLEVRWAQGFTSPNAEFIDAKTACYICGNYMVFLDVETKKRHVLQSPGRGIGAFAANGSSKTLAFSERKPNPSIFVYSYPELVQKSVLKGSAKLEYSALALSRAGPYLACFSGIPDHTLTIWNWENETVICADPNAGKEVIHLMFNPMNWQQICVSRTSSITVWTIERCDYLKIMTTSVISLPAADGSQPEAQARLCHNHNDNPDYNGPQMPISATAGLKGDRAEGFVPKAKRKEKFYPSSVCWTASSDLYVGCRQGHLLLVNLDSKSVSVLLNPQQDADLEGPQLQEGSLQGIVLHRDGLFAAGNDCVLRCLQIKGDNVQITQLWELSEPVVNSTFSPDGQVLLLSSSKGSVYRYRTVQPQQMEKVLDVLAGNFLAAGSLYTDKNLCVSVRDSGVLQLWSVDDESHISSISLQIQVTSLACCPIAQLVAVGTDTGHVLFIDLTNEKQPRVVHRIHLYHAPVSQLNFDHGGNFLLTGASDSNILVLDARPSKMFEVIGFTEAAGAVLGLSTLCNRGDTQVKVLALCAVEKDTQQEAGSRLVALSLPIQKLTGASSCTDLHGRLSDELLQELHCEVPHPLSSAVLGPNNNIFGYCHTTKTLQRFQIPEGTGSQKKDVVQLSPVQEVEGHPLGPASLLLSPHQLWLASVGKDGILRIREQSCIEKYVQMQCHTYWSGGARTVSFSPDGQTLITTGFEDGSMVCVRLRLETEGSSKAADATQRVKSLLVSLKTLQSVENPVLSQLPEWNPDPLSRASSSLQTMEEARRRIDVTEQDESYRSPSSSDTTSDPTWLDCRHAEALKKESQQYAEAKKSLRGAMRRLRETIKEMMQENETLSEMERLEPQEFNLDIDARKRLLTEAEEEVAKVRREAEMENLAKAYLREVIKKECWHSMKVKGKSVKAFHTAHEVKNYPLKARSPQELEEKGRVHTMRKIEHGDRRLQHEIVEKNTCPPKVTEENEDETEDNKSEQENEPEAEKDKEKQEEEEEKKGEEEEEVDKDSPALTGSLSVEYGGANIYLYSQFDLHVREEKINQITLLQDVIYKVKTAFNKEFDAVHKQKVQEINRVKEKNKRISEIMLELEMEEALWEPALSDGEKPELALTVSESEIKVEKYLSLEQRQKEEELKKVEEERLQAAKADNIRERALDDMMVGVLEMKTEGILKTEVAQPPFMSKPEEEWTEDDKKNFKEHEKKVKELNEEQEKHRKTLETEMKKLQSAIQESTQHFDDTLTKLFERKVNCEMVNYQEELKLVNLAQSLMMEDEIHHSEEQFSHKIEETMALKSKIGEKLQKYRSIVDDFRETYDNAVAEDKLLDRGFKKEFADISVHMVDQLYKLYKRRPRVQRIRAQTDNVSSVRPASEGASQMMKAMMDLDRIENMPEDLELSIWERFCQARRTKVESEQRVKQKALDLAEMQAFLQRRINEEEAVKAKITNLMSELNSLREVKMGFQLDLMVQILLKQGQVEVETGRFIPDFSDSELIHRSEVEELNGTIRSLGNQKIASMVEIKDFRKGIIQQEWEYKRMKMLLEDLTNKARDIQMLRVTLELQEYLSASDHDNRVSKQISDVEKRIVLHEKTHQKDVRMTKTTIDGLKRQVGHKEKQNVLLEKQIADLKVTVAERRHICEAIAMEQARHGSRGSRYQEIVGRKKLTDLSKDQAIELTQLRADVERLRKKTFPALTSPR